MGTYFILQNKYLCIYEDSFGAMIIKDDCALRNMKMKKSFSKGPDAMSVSLSCLQSKLYFHLIENNDIFLGQVSFNLYEIKRKHFLHNY